MKKPVLLALLLALLALPACKRQPPPETLLPSDPDVPPPAAVDDFTMDNLLSEFPRQIRSADVRGDAPQLVLFFLPDEPACAADLPDWNALVRDYAPRGLSVLGLIPDSRPAAELRPLLAPLDPPPAFPVGRADSSIILAFGSPTALRVVPTAYLLDAAGAPVRYYPGHVLPSWIREDLDALLSGAPLPDHTPAGVLPEENAP